MAVGFVWHLLPSNILLHIASIQPPRPERGDDRIFWAESTNGEFTVKSAYYAISNIAIHAEDQIWNKVWRWKGLQSIWIFLRLVMHIKLKMKNELTRRHIQLGEFCDQRGCPSEDTLLVIRDGMVAKCF